MDQPETTVAYYSPFNAVEKPDLRILVVLSIVAAKYARRYCYPSQITICALLWRFHGRRMSVRTLCRHLNAFERAGYIRRQRRHCRTPGGRLELHSTLYHLTGRVLSILARLRNAVTLACGQPGGPFRGYAVTIPAEKAYRIGGSSLGAVPMRS